MGSGFSFRECVNATCRFRFPAAANDTEHCPHCGAETAVQAATVSSPDFSPVPLAPPPHVELLLDNIRSVFNVGAILRTADGAGVRRVHLCGITAPPTHPRLAKTALGAEQTVPWQRTLNGVETAASLRAQGYYLWALEATPTAASLFDPLLKLPAAPLLLIVGNEKAGVDPGILRQCDRVLALPMHGVKASLNVAVAAGIALYTLTTRPRS